MVKMGEKYQDSITKFAGIATARSEYLYGCIRVLLEPTELKEGKPVDGVWFDEQRLIESSPATAGGPMSSPIKNQDPH